MRRVISVILAASTLATAVGCTKGGGQSVPPAATKDAVVVHRFDGDPASQQLAALFSFERTIGQILTTSGVPNSAQARADFVSTMIGTFGNTQFVNPISNLPMPVDARPGDAGLDAQQLLSSTHPNRLTPIGLFNRLDLAPGDWSDCGEHRIVYATRPGAPAGRFLLIFEAKLPNPSPGQGMQGCRAVATRWAMIGNQGPSAQRNALLEELYYDGLSGFSPVVHAHNYGLPLGQVRSNSFVNQSGMKWQLREFRVLPVAPQLLAFVPGPVASNPLAELYRNSGGSAQEQTLRGQFHSEFGSTYQQRLRDPDATLPAAPTADFHRELVNRMGAAFHFRFDEFQSDAQGSSDIPAAQAQSLLRGQVDDNWNSPIPGRSVDEAQMLNRAGAITCGGCHEFSNNVPIATVGGTTILWPSSAGFVHISEFKDGSGNQILSAALTNHFIPFRQRVTNLVSGNPTVLRVDGRAARMLAQSSSGTWDPQARAGPELGSEASALAAQPRDRDEPDAARRRAEIRRLAQQLIAPREALGPQDRAEALARLQRLVAEARAEDEQKPGAFVPFRRPH